jgi:hydrogenase expression/formation protein HypC
LEYDKIANRDNPCEESTMCLAIPSVVIEKNDLTAMVDVCGARREVNLMLLPEEVDVGDYVLVHAGFAMQKIDREAAESSLSFFGRLVEAEKARDGEGGDNDEMAEVLRRGTIRWEKTPGKES